jgi:hypothetical protein
MVDASLTNTLNALHAWAAGYGVNPLASDDLSTDVNACHTFIRYYNAISTALGQGTITDTSVDVPSALVIISQLLIRIMKVYT